MGGRESGVVKVGIRGGATASRGGREAFLSKNDRMRLDTTEEASPNQRDRVEVMRETSKGLIDIVIWKKGAKGEPRAI